MEVSKYSVDLKPLFPRLEESRVCFPRSNLASLIFAAGADRGNSADCLLRGCGSGIARLLLKLLESPGHPRTPAQLCRLPAQRAEGSAPRAASPRFTRGKPRRPANARTESAPALRNHIRSTYLLFCLLVFSLGKCDIWACLKGHTAHASISLIVCDSPKTPEGKSLPAPRAAGSPDLLGRGRAGDADAEAGEG